MARLPGVVYRDLGKLRYEFSGVQRVELGRSQMRGFTVLLALALTSGCRSEPRRATLKAASSHGSAQVVKATSWAPSEGLELVGRAAPEWRDLDWLQGGPLELRALRGKLVLIRFWLIDCAFCKATAPALSELHSRFAERGLVVVGVHHPKSDAAREHERIRRTARDYGFEFAVAHDDSWATARAYGVGTAFKRFTSVSVLVDRDGRIVWVHDGGEFHRGGGDSHRDCNRAFEALVAEIEERL